MPTKQVQPSDTTTEAQNAQNQSQKKRKRQSKTTITASFRDPKGQKANQSISLKAKNFKQAIAEVKKLIEESPDTYAGMQCLIGQILGQFEVKSKVSVALTSI